MEKCKKDFYDVQFLPHFTYIYIYFTMALFWKKICSEIIQVCPEQETDITKHIQCFTTYTSISYCCQKFTWKTILKLMVLLLWQVLTSLNQGLKFCFKSAIGVLEILWILGCMFPDSVQLSCLIPALGKKSSICA